MPKPSRNDVLRPYVLYGLSANKMRIFRRLERKLRLLLNDGTTGSEIQFNHQNHHTAPSTLLQSTIVESPYHQLGHR